MAFRSEISSVVYSQLWNTCKLKLDSLDVHYAPSSILGAANLTASHSSGTREFMGLVWICDVFLKGISGPFISCTLMVFQAFTLNVQNSEMCVHVCMRIYSEIEASHEIIKSCGKNTSYKMKSPKMPQTAYWFHHPLLCRASLSMCSGHGESWVIFRNVSQNPAESSTLWLSQLLGKGSAAGRSRRLLQTSHSFLLGHTQVLALPLAVYELSSTCSPAINTTSFHHWTYFSMTKSIPKGRKWQSACIDAVSVEMYMSSSQCSDLVAFLVKDSLFKLTYNRSHKFYSDDRKISFYVKSLFVREKDLITLHWSYFVCKRSHRQWTWLKLCKIS